MTNWNISYIDGKWQTSEGATINVPKTVKDVPKSVPEGQTLVLNSATGEVTAIHTDSISDDYICEVVCNGKQNITISQAKNNTCEYNKKNTCLKITLLQQHPFQLLQKRRKRQQQHLLLPQQRKRRKLPRQRP